MTDRIKKTFSDNKKKLITFVTGGDPDQLTSTEILQAIIKNGADIIEIGMPFSDPMADGPTIQLSSNRAINSDINLDRIFEISHKIRIINQEIPIILMGYYNTILHYGINQFAQRCSSVGIDGLIIVDLQPEEDSALYDAILKYNISLIRLITPNTTPDRLKIICSNASGFLYYVTVTGITGEKSADMFELRKSIKKIKEYSNLPIVAGFGINNKIMVSEICEVTDGVVIGSSIIKIVENNLDNKDKMLKLIGSFVKDLKDGTNI